MPPFHRLRVSQAQRNFNSSTGSTSCKRVPRTAKVPQVPEVPPFGVPDFRGREMLHPAQAQRLSGPFIVYMTPRARGLKSSDV